MKKYFLIIIATATIISCNRKQDQAMKSADKNFILKVADQNFAKKKWRDALALYDRLPNLVAGTDDAPNVVFNSAYSNYYDKNYKLAGHQFKNFSVSFPKDARAEEAAYMSALCYYQGSMDYNLDQSTTDLAINELQEFLTNYPASERGKNINQLIDELTYKLEFKASENAKQYFKIGDYKAANVAFDNVLNDFPSTKLRPAIYDYIMKSRYELATNSVFDLKRDRIENALSFSKQIERELPDSKEAKNALQLRAKLNDEMTRFTKLEKDVEARKAEFTVKQKEFDAKNQNTEKERKQEKDYIKERKKSDAILRDSATQKNPTPAVTFPLQK